MKGISPSLSLRSKLNRIITLVNQKLKLLNGPFRSVLLGSVPRDTYLPKKVDLDFFIYYLNFNTQQFFQQVKEVFPTMVVTPKNRGFPYVTLKIEGVSVDLVPCVVNSMSQKDKTQKHHQYLQSRLTQDLRVKIRRAKKTLKAVGLYDADCSVKGFSGYSVEVMILNYGDLCNVPDDFTLMDPIMEERNLLASLSNENLQRFHLLKRRRFKSRRLEDHRMTLYVWANAPLWAMATLKKHPNVVHVVYIGGNLYVELKDYYVQPKIKLPYDNPFWSPTSQRKQQNYESFHHGLKKLPYERVLDQHPCLHPASLPNRLTYLYFR